MITLISFSYLLQSGDEQEGMAGKGGFIGYSSGYRYHLFSRSLRQAHIKLSFAYCRAAENVQKPRHCRLDKFRIFTLSNDSAAYQSPFTFAGHNSIFSHFQVTIPFFHTSRSCFSFVIKFVQYQVYGISCF